MNEGRYWMKAAIYSHFSTGLKKSVPPFHVFIQYHLITGTAAQKNTTAEEKT